MRVLVVNAGSSSLKLRLLDDDDLKQSADLPAGPDGVDTSGLAGLLRGWPEPDAVGHRVVHGGTRFTGPVRIDDAVRQHLEGGSSAGRPRPARGTRAAPRRSRAGLDSL